MEILLMRDLFTGSRVLGAEIFLRKTEFICGSRMISIGLSAVNQEYK